MSVTILNKTLFSEKVRHFVLSVACFIISYDDVVKYLQL